MAEVPKGFLLRAYLLLSPAIALVAPPLLRRRLKRGKEAAGRWREKLGYPSQPRPPGRLIWLHAVGLGEVLALRGLIAEIAAQAPDLSFLVTSSTRASAQVMGANLPARTVHQFLPLDCPRYLRRFLDHWRPALAVFAEQDIWPGAVMAAAGRGIPVALVNARITGESLRKRARLRGFYRALLRQFTLIDAQDETSAAHLRQLGAEVVQVSGSLKVAAPPLAARPAELADLQARLAGRRVWLAASTHPGDEAEALAAVRALAEDPAWLLILAPRDPSRAEAIAAAIAGAGLSHARRSRAEVPAAQDQVWLADSFGEMGLWYRLADAALIGGGFDRVGGHNPWEAAQLGAAILHGPDVANFRTDYAALHQTGAATEVNPGALAGALAQPARLRATAEAAGRLAQSTARALAPLAHQLVAMTGGSA